MNMVLYPTNGGLQVCVFDGHREVSRQLIENPDFRNLQALSREVLAAVHVQRFHRIICPGGLLSPVRPGVYGICRRVLRDAREERHGKHLYNKVTELCASLASIEQSQALMLDPLSCDELLPLNRMSSLSGVEKRSRYYACAHRAALAQSARAAGVRPEERNVIVVKMDDDVSVGAHLMGVCIEVNDVLGGEGPMGFASTGDLPVGQLVARYFAEGESLESITRTLLREGGVKGYAGTDDPDTLERLISAGDKSALEAAQLLAYQAAKWVGVCALGLGGRVDGIVVMGKGARSPTVLGALRERVEAIAPVEAFQPDVPAYLGAAAHTAGSFLQPVLKY